MRNITFRQSDFSYSPIIDRPRAPKNSTAPLSETTKERGLRLAQESRRNLMKFIGTMTEEPNWHITLRYDFKTKPNRKALYSKKEKALLVEQETWDDATEERKEFLKQLKRLLPSCWGYWIWEIGPKKKGMHIHIALNVNGLSKSLKTKIRSIWKTIINSKNNKSLKFQEVYRAETLHSYLYKKEKARQSYALHCGAPKGSRRCIWDKIHPKLIPTEEPERFSVTEKQYNQFISEIYDFLKSKGEINTKDEEQFERLYRKTAFRHGFSKKYRNKFKAILKRIINKKKR